MKLVYKHSYASLVAMFGLACMFAQFWFHEASVYYAKELYHQFNAIYPEESRTFLWAFESSWRFLDDWLIVGLLAGITTLCLLLVLIAFFARRGGGKEIVGNIFVILTYLLVFAVFSYTFNPLVLHRTYNVVFAFVSSIICGASSHLLLVHDHLRRKRRIQLPEIGLSGDIEKDFRLKSFELEHVEYRAVLHSLMWVFIFLSVGLVFTTLLQYIFALPLEIAFSNTFGRFSVAFAIVFLLNTFGLLVGVFYQLMYEMHDITDLIREQTGDLEKRHQKRASEC